MNTPRLRDVLPDDPRRAVIGASPRQPLFAVVRGGVYGGRLYQTGDVLECVEARPVDKDGEGAWVLVPRGVGFPLLGRHQIDGLFGTAGEPCNPVRWLPAGQVRCVWRQREGAWAQAQAEQCSHLHMPRPQRMERRVVSRRRHQLSLFSALQAA